jgi:predicted neuraminidase
MGGRVGMVYNHTEEHQRHPLSLAWSEDGGCTWSQPRHIDQIHYELSYPSFLCTRGQQLCGLYTYNRRMIKYVCFEASELP